MIKATTFKRKLVIFLLISFSMQAGVTFAKYSGGNGSSTNPWQIANKNDLLEIGYGGSAHFIMINDINLAGDVYSMSLIAPNSFFTGSFDGNGFKIINLTMISRYGYLGLFGKVSGEIKNLGLENVSISGGEYFVGSLAGRCDGLVSNCYSTGVVKGNDYVGGLIGESYGIRISNCYSASNVSGHNWIGGLIGETPKGLHSVLNCYTLGSVNGVSDVGGLIGLSYFIDISNCYSTGFVKGESNVGGLVGYSSSQTSILNSYSAGNVNGKNNIAGLAGVNDGGDISNCYSISDINGVSNTGGLVGWAASSFNNIKNCFWDIEIQSHGVVENIGHTERGKITNVYGLTTSQMQHKITYKTSPANWDFINIWDIGENQTYPYLRQYPASDINQDKKTDYLDLSLLAENWLSGI